LVDASTVLRNFVLDGRGPLRALGEAAPVADNDVFGQAEAPQAAVCSYRFAMRWLAVIGYHNAKVDIASPVDGGAFGLGTKKVDFLGGKFVLEAPDDFVGLLSLQYHKPTVGRVVAG
jgi:hypothetical protein